MFIKIFEKLFIPYQKYTLISMENVCYCLKNSVLIQRKCFIYCREAASNSREAFVLYTWKQPWCPFSVLVLASVRMKERGHENCWWLLSTVCVWDNEEYKWTLQIVINAICSHRVLSGLSQSVLDSGDGSDAAGSCDRCLSLSPLICENLTIWEQDQGLTELLYHTEPESLCL